MSTVSTRLTHQSVYIVERYQTDSSN